MHTDIKQQIAPTTDKLEHTSIVLQSLASALGEISFKHRATACLTHLSSSLNCSRISYGILHRQSVHIEAISHTIKIDAGSELHRDISDAMEESIDQASPIRTSNKLNLNKKLLLTRANEQLKSRMGGLVQTIPFLLHEECKGAITFEWDSFYQHLAPEEHELTQIAHILGPVLFIAYQEDRSIILKNKDAFKHWTRELFGKTTRWSQLMITGLILVIIAGLAVKPIENNIKANAKIEGSIERVIAAPTDGYIEKVHVRLGDQVASGQTVIQLSAAELLIEIERLKTEYAHHENAYIAALARADRSAMMTSLSKAEETRANLELIQQKRSRLTITAPMEGVVIDGDVSQLLGAPITQGDILMTIAPNEGYRVILNIDERDIGKIIVGQRGRLLLSALPHTPIDIHIDRITPKAQLIDGKNVYRVEASLDENTIQLRPGLNGVAKLNSESMPLLASVWYWLNHRIRVLWWRWGG